VLPLSSSLAHIAAHSARNATGTRHSGLLQRQPLVAFGFGLLALGVAEVG
jgi:hypothetical protein